MKVRLSHTHWTFLKFLVVGVVNTAFGYVLYALLVALGLSPQPALALSYFGGVIWNYMTHARLVFGSRGLSRLPLYVLAYLLLYGINAIGLQALLSTGLSPFVAQGLLVLPAAMLAYVLIGRVLTGRFPWSPPA
ncbi:GtrA family protein [Ruegeria sp. HKCCA5763]|uniref:GtrA family protein n=1 Tax=Ruegeria sp. HKCCA5763 TaxID=2682987 RepID=UPI0014891ECE|nr:GtrA family protein [Ruegeria sp. HKCCA5763]